MGVHLHALCLSGRRLRMTLGVLHPNQGATLSKRVCCARIHWLDQTRALPAVKRSRLAASLVGHLAARLRQGGGEAVGEAVGDAVGVAVGDVVGVEVGDAVGMNVGTAVGVAVGDAVGVVVGDAVGVEVGDTVSG